MNQFRALRAEMHIASVVAIREAEAYGAQFGPTEVDRGFDAELEALRTFDHSAELDSGALAARKRWKSIIQRSNEPQWTRGQEYVRLWQEGVLPNYIPDAPVRDGHTQDQGLEEGMRSRS